MTPRPHCPGRTKSPQSGFTLLEVLVAFMVASLLLTVTLSGFSSGLAGLLRADRLSMAAWIAQSRLAESGVIEPLQPGTYWGEEEGHTAYRWEVEISPLAWEYTRDLADLGQMLYRVEVTVSWDSGGREQSFQLATLRLGQEPF